MICHTIGQQSEDMILYSEQLGQQLDQFEKKYGYYDELLDNYIKCKSIDESRYGFKGEISSATHKANRLLVNHTDLVKTMVAARMAEKRYEQINNNSN